MLLFLLLACDVSKSARADCAKVLCAADEYCLSTSGGAGDGETADSAPFGDLPECTQAPEACGGHPSCDCLSCTSCTEADGLVRCSQEVP